MTSLAAKPVPVTGSSLTDRQLRVLRTLAASPGPLPTMSLRRQAGLFVGDIRTACGWLREHRYIQCVLKRVQQPLGADRVHRRLAFWSLTEKGQAYLAVEPVTGTGSNSP